MTSLLFEHPLPLLILGVLIALALAAGFYHTSRLWMLWAAIGAAALTGGIWVLEQAVVTERELVEDELYALAADLERNDLEAVLARFAANSPKRAEVSSILPKVQIDKVTIKDNLKIVLREDQISPVAAASYNCTITLSGGYFPGTHPLFFRVWMRKLDGRWRVTDYQYDQFTAGMKKQEEE